MIGFARVSRRLKQGSFALLPLQSSSVNDPFLLLDRAVTTSRSTARTAPTPSVDLHPGRLSGRILARIGLDSCGLPSLWATVRGLGNLAFCLPNMWGLIQLTWLCTHRGAEEFSGLLRYTDLPHGPDCPGLALCQVVKMITLRDEYSGLS